MLLTFSIKRCICNVWDSAILITSCYASLRTISETFIASWLFFMSERKDKCFCIGSFLAVLRCLCPTLLILPSLPGNHKFKFIIILAMDSWRFFMMQGHKLFFVTKLTETRKRFILVFGINIKVAYFIKWVIRYCIVRETQPTMCRYVCMHIYIIVYCKQEKCFKLSCFLVVTEHLT